MPKVLLFFLFISRVMSWTVDLGEVRKFVVDNEVLSIEKLNENNDSIKVENVTVDGDVKDFDIQNFEEKEVTSIIQNGSIYLEGLSKALMTYRYSLYNCSSNNSGLANPEVNSNKSENNTLCAHALNNTEYIQKLSELALLTTNKLRDKAYDRKYEDDDRDENELLLQLAWLLDRLAHLTGYEPNPKQFINNNDNSSSTLSSTEKVFEKSDTESMEILEQTENGRPLSKVPQKNLTTPKSLEKRSAEKPLENVVNYYVKFKVWNNSNPVTNNLNENMSKKDFDVQNNFATRPITKRSLKKIVILRRKHKN